MMYIYERPDWPTFRWHTAPLAKVLSDVRLRQGHLIGRMETLGLSQRQEVELQAQTDEVVQSSDIEGETLDSDRVRSSIARRLAIDAGAVHPVDRRVEGVVEMTLEATGNFAEPLTRERIFDWHRKLFPTVDRIKVGAWRDDAKGPMRVVSGRNRVHYEAPPAGRVDGEMAAFFDGINREGDADPLLKAGLAHLWFVTIHPFEDGNGRIARAIADWALARSEKSPRRYYSMSAQIRREREDYYDILERIQKGTLDVTDWLKWFLGCLDRAIENAGATLGEVFKRERFWKEFGHGVTNERQRRILDLLLGGDFEGKLTTSKWAAIAKCSQDTAARDIQGLIQSGVLVRDPAGGRSTSYSLSPKACGGSSASRETRRPDSGRR